MEVKASDFLLGVVGAMSDLLVDGQEVKFHMEMACNGEEISFFPKTPTGSYVEFSVVANEDMRKKFNDLVEKIQTQIQKEQPQAPKERLVVR